MLPYGIVFKENIFSFTESVRIWQRKCGVLKTSALVRIFSVLWIVMLIITAAVYFTENNFYYCLSFLVMTAVLNVMVYISTRKNFIRQIANANFSPTEKQIVLFEDRFEVTTGFSKAVYYYDEILEIHETGGLLTIIIDSGVLPLSVNENEIEKGEYSTFCRFLKMNARSKVVTEGGKKI